LESRGVPLGNEIHQIGDRDAENGQERFMLEQEEEIQPVESNENVRFAQNDNEIETPRWDTVAIERGTWIGTPDIRANETIDIASSLNELPDRISMHTDNLINSSGENSILIQLEPKHLGKIKFRVSLKENKISAKMSVESLETKEIIELQLPEIKQSLLQHDVKVTELSISVDNGSHGSNLRNSGFSNERSDFFDNTGSDSGQAYEQGDEHRSDASTGQEAMSDGQVNLLI
jgi:flagellar hook-length control protein FliK